MHLLHHIDGYIIISDYLLHSIDFHTFRKKMMDHQNEWKRVPECSFKQHALCMTCTIRWQKIQNGKWMLLEHIHTDHENEYRAVIGQR